MIASRSFLANVEWTPRARRSFAELMRYLCANEYGDPEARTREIELAVESLRDAPLRCPVTAVRAGRVYRRLIVGGRFLVYYVYISPNDMELNGTVSIRAVKHGAEARPFVGVRESEPDRRYESCEFAPLSTAI